MEAITVNNLLLGAMLLVLIGQFALHVTLPGWERGMGKVSIIVRRVVSESLFYEVSLPDLFLEVEVDNTTWTSEVHHGSRSVQVNEYFPFHLIEFRDVIMFRLKDRKSRTTKVLLAVSPSNVVKDQYVMYKMEPFSFIVMKITWTNVKDSEWT